LATLGAEDKADVLNADATALPPSPEPCDIILMDPPYGAGLITPALNALAARGWLKPGTLIVAETDEGTELPLPPGFDLIDQRAYGRAHIAYIAFSRK